MCIELFDFDFVFSKETKFQQKSYESINFMSQSRELTLLPQRFELIFLHLDFLYLDEKRFAFSLFQKYEIGKTNDSTNSEKDIN